MLVCKYDCMCMSGIISDLLATLMCHAFRRIVHLRVRARGPLALTCLPVDLYVCYGHCLSFSRLQSLVLATEKMKPSALYSAGQEALDLAGRFFTQLAASLQVTCQGAQGRHMPSRELGSRLVWLHLYATP